MAPSLKPAAVCEPKAEVVSSRSATNGAGYWSTISVAAKKNPKISYQDGWSCIA